jgi:hypothetical protein
MEPINITQLVAVTGGTSFTAALEKYQKEYPVASHLPGSGHYFIYRAWRDSRRPAAAPASER